jgi:hypothetical protein
MFALSYNPPVKPDPYQRDPYFSGQETGFKQMAEVAADRNQKRQIELQRQQLQLQRQQEARVARQQQAQLDLMNRQQAIKEKLLPLEMANINAETAKEMAIIEQARKSLSQTPENLNLQDTITRAALTPISNEQATQARQNLFTPKQTEKSAAAPTPQQQFANMTPMEMERTMSQMTDLKKTVVDPLAAAKLLIDNVGISRPIARAEEQATKERQAAIERTATLQGQTTKQARGFGLSDQSFKDFFYEYDDLQQ